MSLANYNALANLLYGGSQRIPYTKLSTMVSAAAGGSSYNSQWLGAPFAGAAPTAAAICDNTTPGGLASYGWMNKIGTDQRLWLDRYDIAYLLAIGAVAIVLVDRLAANGGLSGTAITAQSNGAWPALTRFTNGVGVWAGAEIYSALGATGTTASLSYTNDAGGASTYAAYDIGAAGRNGLGRVLPIPLANGDKGVKAITSTTLLATTGTAGNFGITLFKTLGMWICNNSGIPVSHSGKPLPCAGPLVSPPDNACLQFLILTVNNAVVTAGINVRAFED